MPRGSLLSKESNDGIYRTDSQTSRNLWFDKARSQPVTQNIWQWINNSLNNIIIESDEVSGSFDIFSVHKLSQWSLQMPSYLFHLLNIYINLITHTRKEPHKMKFAVILNYLSQITFTFTYTWNTGMTP